MNAMNNNFFGYKNLQNRHLKMIFKIPALLTIFFYSNTIYAQPLIEWQQAYGGSDYDESRSIHQTRDGNYFVAGITGSNDGDVEANHGYTDFWVLKLDELGVVLWKKIYGGSDLDDALSSHSTTDGGLVVAGFTRSNDGDVSGNHGDSDAWILKLDSVGVIEWQKCLGGSGWEEAWDVQQTIDGGYIVAGLSGSIDGDVTVNHGSLDYWIVKLSSAGNIEWQKSLGGSLLDIAYSINQTNDGGYIVAGESNSPDGDVTNIHGNFDYWVVKLNFEGKIEWQKTLGGTNLDRANEVQQTKEGGYIVLGQARSNNGDVTGGHGGYDYWIVKLTNTGEFEWQRSLGGSGEDYGRHVQQTKDDGYIITGQTQSNNGDVLGNDGGADIWVVKLMNGGEIQWQKSLGGSQAEIGFFIQQTNDEGFILSGSAWSNNGDVSGVQGKTDFWIVKLSPESSPTTALQFSPLQIFPNPAQQSISLQIPTQETSANVIISDLLGRECSRQTISIPELSAESLTITALYPGFYLVTATTSAGKVFSGKFRKE